MLIVTEIVINGSIAFYNKQEQSYIFEIRNHLLPFEVENSVVWYINKIRNNFGDDFSKSDFLTKISPDQGQRQSLSTSPSSSSKLYLY